MAPVPAPATKKGRHDASSPPFFFPLPLSGASSVLHQQPETQVGGGTMAGGTSSLPSQLPTFSLDSECAETGTGAVPTTAAVSHVHDEESPPLLALGRSSNRSSTLRIPTAQVFPGKGELAAVHAQLREELAQLKARGLIGSYRYVQQEMALGVLGRHELEYVVESRSNAHKWKEGGGGGIPAHHQSKMPDGAADTQLGHAFDALQRAVLAPAGLPPKTRFLGVGADTMASLSLVAQDHAAAGEAEGAW